jgi:CBS domain-containing protein
MSDTDHAYQLHGDHPKIAEIVDAGLLVGDVMVTRPKTLPVTATVSDVRQTFANPHVVSALLVDGPTFAGLINRDALPATAASEAEARAFARADVPTVRPGTPVAEAVALLESTGERRLVVLADDGATLAGLICLDESRAGFCQTGIA